MTIGQWSLTPPSCLGPLYVLSGFWPPCVLSSVMRKGGYRISCTYPSAMPEDTRNMSMRSHLPAYLIVPSPFRKGTSARLAIYPSKIENRPLSGVSLKSPIEMICTALYLSASHAGLLSAPAAQDSTIESHISFIRAIADSLLEWDAEAPPN